MKMKWRVDVLVLLLTIVNATFGALAAIEMPSIFGDHMVLQQGKKVALWGTAAPNEKITVSIGDKYSETTANAQGEWKVVIGRMSKGGPYDLVVKGKDSTLRFSDVLLGEVWLGSGQSNMQWPVKSAANPEEEIANANFPNIRLFTVARAVATTPMKDCEGQWVVCSPETIAEFSAVLYYFGKELHQQLNGMPIGLIHTSWGGTPAEAWTSRATLESDSDLAEIVQNWDRLVAEYPEAKAAYEKAMEEWEKKAEKAKVSNEPEPPKPQAPRGPDHPWLASGLYNAMIAPLIPYTIRGAVWYQGESNAGRAYQYRKLFPAMINDWRKAWGQGPFSFYFVQLANFRERQTEPGDSEWAELREAQTMTLALKNTGMAVTIDIGDADDIHPKNKQDVGKRLALNALAKDYDKDMVYSGPMYKAMRIWKGKAILSFSHTHGGLTTSDSGPVKGFALAGNDRKFVWADAVIKDKHVVVSSPQVPDPVAVRYAWASNPDCNLVNGAGLPASPFRTDQWPGMTLGSK